MPPESIIIFTDGASRGNPGPGGWGAIIIASNEVRELGGREAHTTNNRMELTAAIKALEQVQDSRFTGGQAGNKIQVITDSGYLVKGITEWIYRWQKKGWKTANRKPVLNQDLWKQLLHYNTIHRTITWNQIAGHAGTAGNIRADEIATDFAVGKTPRLYSGVLKNYRIKNILDAVHR